MKKFINCIFLLVILISNNVYSQVPNPLLNPELLKAVNKNNVEKSVADNDSSKIYEDEMTSRLITNSGLRMAVMKVLLI